MNELAARDPFYDQKPEHVWILFSNVCDKGKFKVTLEFNGREKPMFLGYIDQDEGVVSESHNLTWLFRTRDAEISRLREAVSIYEGLIESGWLGRDISRDHEHDWAIKQLEPIGKLQRAKMLAEQSPTPSVAERKCGLCQDDKPCNFENCPEDKK